MNAQYRGGAIHQMDRRKGVIARDGTRFQFTGLSSHGGRVTDDRMTDDKVIIDRILSGDLTAYEEVITRCKGQVFSILSKHLPLAEVDEMSQVVFIRAFESLPSFRGEAPFEHWLSRIAVRACYDFWRSRKKDREVVSDATYMQALDAAESIAQFNEECSTEHAKETLDYAMNKLSADDRMVVTLHHLQGYSEKETASLLGWSLAKVKFRAFQSRRALGKILMRRMSGTAR